MVIWRKYPSHSTRCSRDGEPQVYDRASCQGLCSSKECTILQKILSSRDPGSNVSSLNEVRDFRFVEGSESVMGVSRL
jgi:hypothetical protein